ncbi:50S ribosomal protein L18e [Candidatus Nitrosotenuis cloacae]|uniref:50S ribosomal protein L18e n=1 Tax=Candidatus Nitrosotenuis cloacae TaxID=1603555 RepID=UPI00227FC678|nr:50S ribosomal protein L18e [Candidatus Nitrosotenuis cloacae]
MTNQLVIKMVKELKQASAKNQAPIWSKLAEMALKPTIAKRVVNLSQIDEVTNENDVIVVPGKVLGTGDITHKITICSFSISTAAAKKIIGAGGKIVNHSDMISKFPTGKGVRIIG